LIGKHFGVPFLSKKDALFIDKAWAVQIPYPTDDAAIASATVATAQSSGWVWDIGLTTRRGVGYVFPSSYMSDEGALEELKSYLGARGDLSRDLSFRKSTSIPDIAKSSGFETAWQSDFPRFLEPLEASAIVMIELSGKVDCEPAAELPRRHAAGRTAVQRHFPLSLGTHRRFPQVALRAESTHRLSILDRHRARESIPDSLREWLEYWRDHCPWHEDFPHREEVFSAASYQYILYGMDSDLPRAVAAERPRPKPGTRKDERGGPIRQDLAGAARQPRFTVESAEIWSPEDLMIPILCPPLQHRDHGGARARPSVPVSASTSPGRAQSSAQRAASTSLFATGNAESGNPRRLSSARIIRVFPPGRGRADILLLLHDDEVRLKLGGHLRQFLDIGVLAVAGVAEKQSEPAVPLRK